ncbi:MAG: hypothetical protein JF607_14910 [Burkholderiales bacterium]|jgi:hypothetical protein|nr:hypothetical protein [Burkholderiales bacterium]
MKHDDPRHRSPPRAEPLQPDRPGRGAQKQVERSSAAPAKGQQGDVSGGARKLKQQTDDAVENAREGYGKS